MTDQEKIMKEWIDSASYEMLYRKSIIAKPKDPLFEGEIGQYYRRIMAEKRCENIRSRARKNKGIKNDQSNTYKN